MTDFPRDPALPDGSIDPATLDGDPEGARAAKLEAATAALRPALKVVDRPSPNCYPRGDAEVNLIVLHYDESPRAAPTIAEVTSPGTKKSYHALVSRDSSIVYRFVAHDHVAEHAGVSSWPGATHYRPGRGGKSVPSVNLHSLGLALGNTGSEDYPADQLAIAAAWCAYAMEKYPAITLDRIVGHADVALPKGRKVDPGPQFPWDHFRYLVQLEREALRAAEG